MRANQVSWEAAVGAAFMVVHAGMLVPYTACLLQAPAWTNPHLQPQHAQVHHQKGREGQDGAVGMLRLNRRLARRQVWGRGQPGCRRASWRIQAPLALRRRCLAKQQRLFPACWQVEIMPHDAVAFAGRAGSEGPRSATSGGWLASPHLELLAHGLRHLLLLLTPHPAGCPLDPAPGPTGGACTAPWRQEA